MAANLLAITPDQMLFRGLKAVGVTSEEQLRRFRSSNCTNFKSHYGIHPNHASTLWNDLMTTTIPAARVDEDDANLLGLLWALNFLRINMSLRVRRSLFRWKGDINLMGTTIWFWVDKIAALVSHKIKWPTEFDTTFVYSVDGTMFRMNEPRDPDFQKNPEWFNHKHRCAGWNVQVVLHIHKQQCCHIQISKGKENDMANLNLSGIFDHLPDGCKAIVDGGYAESHRKLSGYNQFDTELVKHYKARVKSRQETFNARLKIFQILKHKFEYGKEKFPVCFTAVAVLVQYMIEDTNPESANPLFNV